MRREGVCCEAPILLVVVAPSSCNLGFARLPFVSPAFLFPSPSPLPLLQPSLLPQHVAGSLTVSRRLSILSFFHPHATHVPQHRGLRLVDFSFHGFQRDASRWPPHQAKHLEALQIRSRHSKYPKRPLQCLQQRKRRSTRQIPTPTDLHRPRCVRTRTRRIRNLWHRFESKQRKLFSSNSPKHSKKILHWLATAAEVVS